MILDIYDDPNREILHTKVAAVRSIERHIDPPEKLAKYPDDLFALVMRTDHGKLRKFACVSKPQTALSALYFTQTWQNLPAPAVPVAATNIKTACGWYDLPVPEEVEKLADWNPVGRSLEMVKQAAKSDKLHPYVDVRGHKPAYIYVNPPVVKKARFELPKIADTHDVEKAVEAFLHHRGLLKREDKVAYCRHLVKEAEKTGYDINKLPDEVRLFGSTKLASADTILARIVKRASVIQDDRKRRAYLSVAAEKLAKLASHPHGAEEAASALAELEKRAGLDRYDLPDPQAVFFEPVEKRAYKWVSPRGKIVTEQDLHKLATVHLSKLARKFNADFVGQFIQQPVEFFDSLPDVMKEALFAAAESQV